MLIGQHIGPFEIEEELGSGAMGTVYLAKFHKDDGVIPVALKVVSLGLLGNEGAMARFEREANILKQLRHPHIVRLFATGRYKKTPFIAMEYVDGPSLDRVIARRGKIPWEDVVAYGRQLCDALSHAHEKGIVHRDLKPSNLMVTDDGTLKLTDFGIAKDVDVTALTGANSTIGTAAYMSPEQCKGDKTLSLKSDLYSLGIVFYELVTGKKPFVAETSVEMFLKHVNETPVRPSRIAHDIPIWFDNLIMFLLEKKPQERPLDAATVGKMLADIEQKVTDQQSVGAELAHAKRKDRRVSVQGLDESDKDAARLLRGKKKKKKPGPWHRNPWVRGAAIVAALAAVVGGGGYLIWRETRPESVEVAYARVEAAQGHESRARAAEEFLAAHGTKSDPQVEQARAVYREEKARLAEATLYKWVGKKTGRPDLYPDEAFRVAMQALDAEAAGRSRQAIELWTAVREKHAVYDPTLLPSEAETNKGVLGWVGEVHVRLIEKAAPEAEQKLLSEIAEEQRHEVPRDFDPTTPEGMAYRALRLEKFGDKTKARERWTDLATKTDRDADRRTWFILASLRAADIPAEKGSEDDVKSARIGRLTARLAALQKEWERLSAGPDLPAERRNVRNGCRDIIDLYADESLDPIKAIIVQARTLLESVPK